MTVKVVDASAIAAVCFVEPERQTVIDLLKGVELAAPDLIDFELANICWKRSKKSPLLAAQYRLQFLTRKTLRITISAVAFNEVVDLALATGLTAYDASYLWLARRLGVELVTLDRQLARAAASSA